jgi:hypothetical protein
MPVAWSRDTRRALVMEFSEAETRLDLLDLETEQAKRWAHPRGTVGGVYCDPRGSFVVSLRGRRHGRGPRLARPRGDRGSRRDPAHGLVVWRLAPLLVIQSSNDTRCPRRQMEVYEKRMRELGKEIEVVWFEAGHGSYAIERNIEHQERMLSFAAAGRAPVYMYLFSYETDILGGRLRSPHALEIPFVFDVVDDVPLAGTKPDRQQLADRMSEAWLAFGRSGDPNHAGLPTWPAYTARDRATLLFDSECRKRPTLDGSHFGSRLGWAGADCAHDR